MNEQDIVDAIAAKTSASKASAADTLDALIGTITTAVTKGDTVQLIGFGSFSTGARAARVGRNPATVFEKSANFGAALQAILRCRSPQFPRSFRLR